MPNGGLSRLAVGAFLLLDVALLVSRVILIETSHPLDQPLTLAFGTSITATLASLTLVLRGRG